MTDGDALQRGRDSYAQRAWLDAHEALLEADRSAPLDVDDLVLLATAAYMRGRDEEFAQHLERAHRLCLDAGDELRAARAAFFIGMTLTVRGEVARGTGWLGRAQRLVERAGGGCVERGDLLMPA